jgi:hypothetical protein
VTFVDWLFVDVPVMTKAVDGEEDLGGGMG